MPVASASLTSLDSHRTEVVHLENEMIAFDGIQFLAVKNMVVAELRSCVPLGLQESITFLEWRDGAGDTWAAFKTSAHTMLVLAAPTTDRCLAPVLQEKEYVLSLVVCQEHLSEGVYELNGIQTRDLDVSWGQAQDIFLYESSVIADRTITINIDNVRSIPAAQVSFEMMVAGMLRLKIDSCAMNVLQRGGFTRIHVGHVDHNSSVEFYTSINVVRVLSSSAAPGLRW